MPRHQDTRKDRNRVVNGEIVNVHLHQHVRVEARLNRCAAQRRQHAQPFGAQRLTARRQLGAHDRNVVEPVVVCLPCHRNHGVAHETVPVGGTLGQLLRPLGLNLAASLRRRENFGHKLGVVGLRRGRRLDLHVER